MENAADKINCHTIKSDKYNTLIHSNIIRCRCIISPCILRKNTMTYSEFKNKTILTNAELAEIFGGTEEKFAKIKKEDEMYSTLIYSGISSDRAAAIAFR